MWQLIRNIYQSIQERRQLITFFIYNFNFVFILWLVIVLLKKKKRKKRKKEKKKPVVFQAQSFSLWQMLIFLS